MSSLQKILPASEPARSQALAQLKKTHHIPRHLVKGIAQADLGKRGLPAQAEPQMDQQQPAQDPQSPESPLQTS